MKQKEISANLSRLSVGIHTEIPVSLKLKFVVNDSVLYGGVDHRVWQHFQRVLT